MSPNNGDIWYNSTNQQLMACINGANIALGAGGTSGVSTSMAIALAVAL
jgi:hypothetical protein